MDSILIILKKKMAQGHLYIQQISGERLQDHWSSGLIFINLPDSIRSPVADDCVLYRNIKSLTDCQILQDDLNSLAKWETNWQMKLNVAKCQWG